MTERPNGASRNRQMGALICGGFEYMTSWKRFLGTMFGDMVQSDSDTSNRLSGTVL